MSVAIRSFERVMVARGEGAEEGGGVEVRPYVRARLALPPPGLATWMSKRGSALLALSGLHDSVHFKAV